MAWNTSTSIFCTLGSSGIGDSGRTLERNAGSGTWLAGERFAAGTVILEGKVFRGHASQKDLAKQRILRSLMNIRPPRRMPERVLKVQDA